MEIRFDKAKNTALVTFAAEVPMAGAFETETVEVWDVATANPETHVGFGSEADARNHAAAVPGAVVTLKSRTVRYRCPDRVITDHAKREATGAFHKALAACGPAVPPPG